MKLGRDQVDHPVGLAAAVHHVPDEPPGRPRPPGLVDRVVGLRVLQGLQPVFEAVDALAELAVAEPGNVAVIAELGVEPVQAEEVLVQPPVARPLVPLQSGQRRVVPVAGGDLGLVPAGLGDARHQGVEAGAAVVPMFDADQDQAKHGAREHDKERRYEGLSI